MKIAFLFCCVLFLLPAFVNTKVRIDVSKEAETKTAPALPSTQRMIIRNADLRTEVLNNRTTILRLKELIADKRGFIISSNTNSSEQDRNTITVVARVPASVFDETIEEIASLSSRVISTSTYGNNVTDDYTRIISQLENRNESQQRYRNMLKSAKRVDEIIAVERYFAEVRRDIERLESELQSINDKVSLLTIEVKLQEVENNKVAEESDFKNVGTGVGKNLTGSANILDIGISFLASAIPIVLFLLVPAYFLLKLGKKYKLVKRDNIPHDSEQ